MTISTTWIDIMIRGLGMTSLGLGSLGGTQETVWTDSTKPSIAWSSPYGLGMYPLGEGPLASEYPTTSWVETLGE